MRMKLAAGLAILHGTTNVSDVLWEASGHVIDPIHRHPRHRPRARQEEGREGGYGEGHAAAIADEVKEERKLSRSRAASGHTSPATPATETVRHARQSNSRWGGIRRWSMAESRRQSTSDTSRNGKTTRSQAGITTCFTFQGR